MPKTVRDVRIFWEAHPLWTGESSFESGTKEFFDEHRLIVIEDCFAGRIDKRIFPKHENLARVLDLGCGPGMWLVELGRKGVKKLFGADITFIALALAQKRCELYGIPALLSQQNAEHLAFQSESFTHVNCQGVIHHTPNTETCIQEIARVLKPGGTATISGYYKNVLLKSWPYIRWAGKIISRLGGKLKGRGREAIYEIEDVNEIVRIYDGANNPIGKSYDKNQWRKMVSKHFIIDEVYIHFFPSRTLPIKLPNILHRFLNKYVGFMIVANLRKP